MYGAPAVDGVTVRASVDGPLDGHGRDRRRPGLRAQGTHRHPLLGRVDENSRVHCATGFSGKGFKMATGHGHIAAHEALAQQTIEGLDFVRPDRFRTRWPPGCRRLGSRDNSGGTALQ